MRMRITRKNRRKRDPRYFLHENLDLEGGSENEDFPPETPELETSIDPSSSPSKIVSDLTFRTAAGVEFGTDYAKDPTYAPKSQGGEGLGDNEYNIRGQYLVYRLDNNLRFIDLDKAGAKERHYNQLHNDLQAAGWEEKEDAAIPTPEDYRGVK